MAIELNNFRKQNTIDFQEQVCEKFAKEHGIPLVDIYTEVNKYFDENIDKVTKDLTSEEEVKKATEDLKVKSLIRGRSTFKRKALSLKRLRKNGISSFILFRFRDQDFNKSAWEKVDEYIRENNISDEMAKENGLMDNDGNYLFTGLTTSFSDQFGKKIDKDMITGSAIGFFEHEDNGEKKYEARFVKIGYAGNKHVPICRPSVVEIKEGDSSGPIFSEKVYFYNNGIEENNNMIMPLSFANYILNLCSSFLDEESFVQTYDEVIDLGESIIEEHEKWGYVAVEATCSSVGQFSDPTKNIPVEFEIYDEIGDINTITTFVPPKHFEGMSLIEGSSGLLFLVNPYFNKDGEVRFHLGGFMPIGDE